MIGIIGTIIFLIILAFATQIYWKLIIPHKEVIFTSLDTGDDKIDIIVPAIYPRLAVRRTAQLSKHKAVNKIILITPKDGKVKNNNKYFVLKDGGNGRAAAINSALKYVESDNVLLLDEDLYVPKKTLNKGLILLRNNDIIKLNLLPKDGKSSIFHRMISIERKYTELEQQPKSLPLFGGTGFFKTKVLKDLKFDNNFLTEDVELSVRAHIKGYKFGSYRELTVYEDYPNLKGWRIQRRRWAAGWFQVFKSHKKDLKNRKVLRLIGSQPMVFMPFLMIIGMITGNIFSPHENLILSAYAISPLFVLGLKYDKKYGILYPFYFFLLLIYSTIACIFPPKKYYTTPKDEE